MTYRSGTARTSSGVPSLLLLLAAAVVLSGLRLAATVAALTPLPGPSTTSSSTQTWVFAVIWIVAYLAQSIAGQLVWRNRVRPYGRPALVVLGVLIGLQALRLLNLLGNRLTAGQVPWSAFGTVVLLDVCTVVGMLLAWQVSRRAGALLALVLGWMLFVTALTGADALLRNGLPLT